MLMLGMITDLILTDTIMATIMHTIMPGILTVMSINTVMITLILTQTDLYMATITL